MPRLRWEVHAMSNEFVEAVREANWSYADSLIEQGEVSPLLEIANTSVYEWLVQVNAPSQLVIDLLRRHPESEALGRLKSNLMESCLRESSTKGNAFGTFALLLAEGISPNLIVNGGCTLLQEAMELNRTREVRELLRYNVDPHQMSVFGRDSSSNIDEAARLKNEAAELVLTHFAQRGT